MGNYKQGGVVLPSLLNTAAARSATVGCFLSAVLALAAKGEVVVVRGQGRADVSIGRGRLLSVVETVPKRHATEQGHLEKRFNLKNYFEKIRKKGGRGSVKSSCHISQGETLIRNKGEES